MAAIPLSQALPLEEEMISYFDRAPEQVEPSSDDFALGTIIAAGISFRSIDGNRSKRVMRVNRTLTSAYRHIRLP